MNRFIFKTLKTSLNQISLLTPALALKKSVPTDFIRVPLLVGYRALTDESKLQDDPVNQLEDLIQKHNLDLKKLEANLIFHRGNKPYNIFLSHKIKSLRLENPTLNSSEAIEKLGAEWTAIEPKEKLVWLQKAKDQNEKSHNEIESMLLDVPVEDVLKIKVLLKKIYWMANLKKRARKRARQIKSARLKHNQPQKPKNSWMLFLETQDRGDASIKDFLRGASYKWAALTVQDKEEFEIIAAERAAQYQVDLAEWEANMVHQGKLELIRRSVRRTLMQQKKNEINKLKRLRRLAGEENDESDEQSEEFDDPKSDHENKKSTTKTDTL